MLREIKIVIADDHEIYREGLKMALGKISGIKLIAEASDGCELLRILEKHHPDIVLLDIEMPVIDGIEAAKVILKTYPGTKIIALTMFNDPEYLASIISAGVSCFLSKNMEKAELKRAIESVMEGRLFFPIHYSEYRNQIKFTVMKTNKILIVDDDIDVITILETVLTKKGYKVVTAFNKHDGMQKIKEEKPDLAILDVMMTTHYEGFEMAKEITDDPELRKIPVLMQTSIDVLITSRSDVREMALEFRKNPGFKDLHVLLVKDIVTGKAGIDYLSEKGQSIWFPVDGFLSKPVDTVKLLPEIEKVLKVKSN